MRIECVLKSLSALGSRLWCGDDKVCEMGECEFAQHSTQMRDRHSAVTPTVMWVSQCEFCETVLRCGLVYDDHCERFQAVQPFPLEIQL
ncbi:hypothetical protein B0H12DRAFT_105825 [Mycena haematopus]|nr:hypothetical protein B0H12DRAFT_105825 [Mycena haematopus]